MALVSVIPQGDIGGIAIDATLEEVLTDTLEATENPVQVGAQITDHSFDRPSDVVLTCGWSNVPVSRGFGQAATNLVNSVAQLFAGGSLSGADYVGGVYSRLLALKRSRQPFDITTTIRVYHSMLMRSLVLERDQKTSQALMVRAVCREVILVDTQSTLLPPAANQASPQDTQDVEDVGAIAPQQATPAPGGSVPPQDWTQQ